MKLKHKVYTSIEALTPPILFRLYKSSFLHRIARKALLKTRKIEAFTWHKVRAGELAGEELPFEGKDHWQKEMIYGTYDKFFFDYLKHRDLSGKTIYEIGAHIGYHALAFAKMVGTKGHVIAFEPNPHNAEYIRAIVDRNPTLSPRIELVEAALSSSDGEEVFISSDKVDEGLSSGGFIGSADTIWDKKVYEEKTGFTRSTVTTMRLDSFLAKGKPVPDILKVDIEGAEGQMLEGAKEFLASHSPLILVEVHSTKSMYDVLTLISSLGYSWEILKNEDDGRCFLACEKK